jgi:D-alanyl-D-alanine carboxypeptidase/D-alanyl-D-alanine-endopeptidase (penicillin-binding protein 4)
VTATITPSTTTSTTPSTTEAPTTTRPTAPPTTLSPAARLAPRLTAVLSGYSGCLVVEDGGTVIYSDNAGVPFLPASTEKLLTATTALTKLGPSFRFETDVVAAAAPTNGTVSDLWLVGSGDPMLATPAYAALLAEHAETAGFPVTPLSSLASALAAAGVKTVTNGIHGDDSRYDRQRYVPSWPAFYASEDDIGPLSALGLNEGLVSWSGTPVVASDPPAFAAAQLAQLLGGDGVHAAGAADSTAPTSRVVLARVYSAPLATIISEMLRISDNYTAEMLTKEIGRQVAGVGSTVAGTGVTARTIANYGLPTSGLHLVDGSGLDRGDRSTCQLEMATLDLASRTPLLAPISAGLAVAGETGTLFNRYNGTRFQGRVEAKTGSLDGVMGMVGHEEVGRALRFAFIVNGNFTWPQGAAIEDRLLFALATYPN